MSKKMNKSKAKTYNCTGKTRHTVEINKSSDKKLGISFGSDFIITKIGGLAIANNINIQINDKIILINGKKTIANDESSRNDAIAIIKNSENLTLCLERKPVTKSIKKSKKVTIKSPKKTSKKLNKSRRNEYNIRIATHLKNIEELKEKILQEEQAILHIKSELGM
jgi:hypothetical protein